MPDPNLTAALNASLKLVDENPTSPLTEATPDSVDLYLDRINAHLIEGAPDRITDEELIRVVEFYRAKALTWTQEEQVKKTKSKAKPVPHVEAVDLGLDSL